ncbi:MAG: acyl-CoA carboxylase epsilon subunit [Candidatus Nanopelagicales bacterium]
MNGRFEVVNGDPSDEELAVVVSLLAAAASAPVAQPPTQPSNWGSTQMRVTFPAGPGAWWRTGLPRP